MHDNSDNKTDAGLDASIEDLERDLKDIQEEGAELIPDLRRSTRNTRPIERLTYAQRAQEVQECRFNLFSDVIDEEQVLEYTSDEAYVLGHIIEDIDHKLCFGQQYTLKKGLLKYGKAGKIAATKEVEQLHERKCFRPVNIGELSNSERRKAQIALAYLTQKRDGKIKGRLVYNGKPT